MPKFTLQNAATLKYYKSSGVSEELHHLSVNWVEDQTEAFRFADKQAALLVAGMIAWYYPELQIEVGELNG